MADHDAAKALAEKIQFACYEAILEWGDAVNRAEAAPKDPLRQKIARAAGEQALKLAIDLAKRLRPGAMMLAIPFFSGFVGALLALYAVHRWNVRRMLRLQAWAIYAVEPKWWWSERRIRRTCEAKLRLVVPDPVWYVRRPDPPPTGWPARPLFKEGRELR